MPPLPSCTSTKTCSALSACLDVTGHLCIEKGFNVCLPTAAAWGYPGVVATEAMLTAKYWHTTDNTSAWETRTFSQGGHTNTPTNSYLYLLLLHISGFISSAEVLHLVLLKVSGLQLPLHSQQLKGAIVLTTPFWWSLNTRASERTYSC